MSSLILAAVTSLLAVVPYTPHTVGAWTTYLRPVRYSDLLVRGDTVWCATREAGLLRYSLSGRRFAGIARFPNGLASNELSALAYDRSGRLWVGTIGAGVSRMSADGSRWALVNAFDGLPSDTVNCLEAEGDSMWIGTPRGIAFWDGTQIAGSLPIFGQPSPFASDNITGIVVHKDTLWVSTSDGIYFSRRSTGLSSWTAINGGLFTHNVSALVSNDTLMFCQAAASAYSFNGSTWNFKPGSGFIFRMFDDNGIVTATTDAGLFRLTNGGWVTLDTEKAGANQFDISTIWIPAPAGNDLYVAANATGLSVRPNPTALTGWLLDEPDAPPDNEIRNINLDGNRVWANSNNKGIGRFDGSGWRIWKPTSTPTPCPGPDCDSSFSNPLFPWALLVDKQGHKWFGCWEYAVDELVDSGPTPFFTHHIINDALGRQAHTRTWASAVDSTGGRWFGTDTPSLGEIEPIGVEYYRDSSGIAVYTGNIRTSNSNLAGNKVHGLTVDKFNRVWVGMTGQGIMRFDIPATSPTGAWSPPTLERILGTNSLDVQGLVARGDTIWALTTHELQRYRRTTNDFPVATYPIPEATPLFAANPLAVGPDGSPWVGTEAGMRVYRAGGSSEDFNTRNSPIAGDQIYAIRVDRRNGVVWIATSTGMNRYDPGYHPPAPPKVAQLDVTPYPNPISINRTGILLRLRGNAGAYEGVIVDITGRRIRRFTAPANGRVIWDGKNEDGDMVQPGLYLLHVQGGGSAATVRVVLLR